MGKGLDGPKPHGSLTARVYPTVLDLQVLSM